MLDAQRYRGEAYREEVDFTRRLLWAHLIAGALVVVLFLFHEVFRWFAGAAIWYLVSLALMYVFMSGRRGFRLLLAMWFLVAAAAGLYFINRVFPDLDPARGLLVPHGFIPLWVGFANLTYAAAALLLLFSKRVRRAGSVDFTL